MIKILVVATVCTVYGDPANIFTEIPKIHFISIYKVLQLDDENRNMDMKLFLEEMFANY